MFWFHRFFRFDSRFTLIFATHCERISTSWLSIWNEGGEFWCEARVSRNEPDPQLGGLPHLKGLNFVTILGGFQWLTSCRHSDLINFLLIPDPIPNQVYASRALAMR